MASSDKKAGPSYDNATYRDLPKQMVNAKKKRLLGV